MEVPKKDYLISFIKFVMLSTQVVVDLKVYLFINYSEVSKLCVWKDRLPQVSAGVCKCLSLPLFLIWSIRMYIHTWSSGMIYIYYVHFAVVTLAQPFSKFIIVFLLQIVLLWELIYNTNLQCFFFLNLQFEKRILF